MVRVLVGQRKSDGEDGEFIGFWAEFEGEEVTSYEDTRGENNIVYTLYRCTAYHYEAYRVHIADESDPNAPVYELQPYVGDLRVGGGRPNYSEPWEAENLAEKYPLFLKDMDYFHTRYVDPGPRP